MKSTELNTHNKFIAFRSYLLISIILYFISMALRAKEERWDHCSSFFYAMRETVSINEPILFIFCLSFQ